MLNRAGIKFKIVRRILDGRNTVGYDLVTSNSGVIPTRKEQVQMMASQGCIVNASAEFKNNKVRLVGRNGENLSKLKTRQIGKCESLA